MKNSIGHSVILTLAGESHGQAVCAILDGLAPGLRVDEAFIAEQLSHRRPSGPADTARREPDEFKIVSGVLDGHTTGAPICIMIPNTDVRSADYASFDGLARPSHADLAAHVRYGGFEDRRGGGHFSGRITVGIVAAGAIALDALRPCGISIETRVLSCGGASGDDPAAVEAAILAAKAEGDSVGGKIQTVITGVPAGVGEPWFTSLEGELAAAAFSIGGVKGVEFGDGFALVGMKGSQANDSFYMDEGVVKTRTNHSGGINGGLSNGMPIVFSCAVKPTPSIAKPQQTVNFLTGEEATLELHGRHDPAIVRRICPVMTALSAIVICDMLALRFGTDWIAG